MSAPEKKTNRRFGTDGIRDLANAGFLTPEEILKTGSAIGDILQAKPDFFLRAPMGRHLPENPVVVLGADTRRSAALLESALCAGLLACGVDVRNIGVVTTPALAHITREFAANAGIMISASHNPFGDNGIKVFGGDGYKISEKAEAVIEASIGKGGHEARRGKTGDKLGALTLCESAADVYADFLLERFRNRMPKGISVVLDFANGAAHRFLPLFEKLGLRVAALHKDPDGKNINDSCGALHPESAAQLLKQKACAAGFAFDGDGDRVICIDEKGGVLTGDHVLAMLGPKMKAENRLRGDTVVSTVMSNLGLELYLKDKGIKLLRTPVGDKYISEEMLKGDYALGGEQSGHVIFGGDATTGDGILTALKVLELLAAGKQSLSALASVLKEQPQILLNVRVREKIPFENLTGLLVIQKEVEDGLHGRGRLLLRYSGTEPVARVMIEGADRTEIEKGAKKIADAIRAEIGAE